MIGLLREGVNNWVREWIFERGNEWTSKSVGEWQFLRKAAPGRWKRHLAGETGWVMKCVNNQVRKRMCEIMRVNEEVCELMSEDLN